MRPDPWMRAGVQQRLDRKKPRRAASGSAGQGVLDEPRGIGVSAGNSKLRGANHGGIDEAGL